MLEFNGNFGDKGISGLDEIGYKHKDDYDYDWLATESQSAPTDHLVIRFDSGATLRVHSESADFIHDRTLVMFEGRQGK